MILAVVVGAALIDTAAEFRSCAHDPRPQDVAELARHAVVLDLDAPYRREDYQFLDRAIGSASIVQLGESLHITQELPRIRLQVIRYLHEQLGFDTLALEGSLTQAWLAQEYFYRSHDPIDTKIDRAREMAWFRLWRTQPMRELMAYVEATQHTPHPLYLTSFDVEIGQSSAFGNGEDIVPVLFTALEAFGPPPDPTREATWHAALEAMIGCMSNPDAFVAKHADVSTAADEIGAWIDAIAPVASTQRPPGHVAALRMIAANIRDHIELCSHVQTWQGTRDKLNAATALKLRERISASHRILLWAHHSHVAYNSTGRNIVSMGEHLHAQLGADLYTIGVFAGGGRIIAADLFGERDLPSTRTFGVERLLQAVYHDAYFVDLKTLPTIDPHAGWLIEDTSRLEALSHRSTVLAKDFDGAIYIAHVHPAAIMDSFVARWVLRIFGFVVQHVIGVAILLVIGLGWAIWALARWIRRRLRR